MQQRHGISRELKMSDCQGGYESDSSEEDGDRVKPLPTLQGRKKSIRFREPLVSTRRLSRFPSLQRRESIISSYRSGLYDPKVVTFVKNGDKFFEGVKINVSQRNFRSFDILLSELSRCIELPAGVRNVYTPEGGHRVTKLTQFEHKQTYVCASTEPFRKMDYGNLKNPNWQSAAKLKHQPPPESVFSKNFNLNASLNASMRSLNGSVQSEKALFTKPRRQSVKPVRPKQMRLSSIVTEADEESPQKEKVDTLSTLRVPNPTEPKPMTITIIRNGPPPRQCVTVLLNKNSIVSWEHATRLISENLNTINGCLRLFKLDGEKVQSLSQLWKAGNMLIAVGNEAFSISEFMRGQVHAPVEQTCQQVNFVEGVAVKGSSELATSESGEVDLREQPTAPSQIGTKEAQARPDSGSPNQSQDYSHSQDIDSEVVYHQSQQPQETLSKPHFPATPPHTIPIEDLPQMFPPKNYHLFGQDRPNTGSSYSSVSMLPGVSTPRVFPTQLIRPQTPQSEVSIGAQSIVDMILPRVMDRMDCDASTFSGESSSSTKEKTSRNIGIQTDFVDNHLSTVFETENELTETQSSMKFMSRGEGVRLQRQNSTASQTDFSTDLEASSNSRHSKKKEKYTIGMLIGEGNYAVVKEIREKKTNRDLVLRVINKAKVFGQEDLITNELKIMKTLRHENILQVVDDWETSDEICLVLEQIEGGDLFDTILHCQHFSEPDAMKAMRQLGLALVYLHAHKIVHRDIKPENIFALEKWEDRLLYHFSSVCMGMKLDLAPNTMATDTGANTGANTGTDMAASSRTLLTSSSDGSWNLKLGGFSLAIVVTEPLSLVCGTTYYMAPEMLIETGYGTKIDVWAAGIICYILLTGCMPFRQKSNMDMLDKIKSAKYSFPSPFWDHVSEEAKDFIRHLLVATPQNRYSSSEMLQHSWLKEHPHWEQSQSSTQLSRRLVEHLNSKLTSKNAAFSILMVTALDKRRGKRHDRKLQ